MTVHWMTLKIGKQCRIYCCSNTPSHNLNDICMLNIRGYIIKCVSQNMTLVSGGLTNRLQVQAISLQLLTFLYRPKPT
jgi:hypothetical protein